MNPSKLASAIHTYMRIYKHISSHLHPSPCREVCMYVCMYVVVSHFKAGFFFRNRIGPLGLCHPWSWTHSLRFRYLRHLFEESALPCPPRRITPGSSRLLAGSTRKLRWTLLTRLASWMACISWLVSIFATVRSSPSSGADDLWSNYIVRWTVTYFCAFPATET